jgi:predicted GIY-YIG superfamily endonuclease
MSGKTVVYVLELVDGHYYVGKTGSLEDRIKSHLGGSCRWTSLHPPVKVVRVDHGEDTLLEDKITKELMFQHGIDRVRG